jgi:tetratricopeptide (TPR) repeat protein
MDANDGASIDPSKQLRLAFDLRNEGRLAEAQSVLEGVVRADLASARMLWFLAHLYWDQKLLPQAIETFEAAVRAAPTWEDASLGLFHCLWETDQRDAAFGEIRRFQKVADSEDYRAIIAELSSGDCRSPGGAARRPTRSRRRRK